MEGARGRRRRRRTSREPEPTVLRISQSPLRVCTGTSAWIRPGQVRTPWYFSRFSARQQSSWCRSTRSTTIRPRWRRGYAMRAERIGDEVSPISGIAKTGRRTLSRKHCDFSSWHCPEKPVSSRHEIPRCNNASTDYWIDEYMHGFFIVG